MSESTVNWTRRGVLAAFAATAVVAAPHYANAFSIRRGAGDIRRLTGTGIHGQAQQQPECA